MRSEAAWGTHEGHRGMTLREQVRYGVLARPPCGAEKEEMHDLDDVVIDLFEFVERERERRRLHYNIGWD